MTHLVDLTVTFYLQKILSPEQKQQDPLGRPLFDQVWRSLASFICADGSVNTTNLLNSYLRIKHPNFDTFYGGFFFRVDGQPWGFTLDDTLPITADYISYAHYWLEAALKTQSEACTCKFSIHGGGLSLSRQGKIGTITDEGYLNNDPRYAPISFDYDLFWEQLVLQMSLYQRVYQDLMRRVQWVAQDPARLNHVEAIKKYIPSFADQYDQIQQATQSPN